MNYDSATGSDKAEYSPGFRLREPVLESQSRQICVLNLGRR
jgi:hypothetical protein